MKSVQPPRARIHRARNGWLVISLLGCFSSATGTTPDPSIWPYTQEDWDRRRAAALRFENVLIAVKPGGTGDISDTHVAWRSQRGIPYVPSPLFYDGRIYLVKDGGLISSFDARTGDPQYLQERIGANGNYYASPVAAAGRIYLASLAGKLSVVQAGGTRPEVLRQVDFGTRIVATPAISGESLFVRTATHLWAFGR